MNKFKPFKNPIYVTKPIFPPLSEVEKELQKVWKAEWLTNNGKQHQILEEKIKKVLKVPYVSMFNNGAIGLLIACKALKLTGEVITTPFTFPATPHALTWNNLTPVFCDVDERTMNIDADKIEALITPKTTAILAVHVFGTPCDVKKIEKIAKKHKLKVIYDAAHAFGVEIDGRGIGTYGDITMFSFHATKLFHTAEGGCLAFNSKEMKEHVELLKNFGIKNEFEVVEVGINGKMNEVQASIGLVVLNHLKDERKRRAAILKTYKKNLKGIDGITYHENASDVVNSYQYFVIRVDKSKFGLSRDEVYDEFKKYNVFTRKYFFPLCSSYKHYMDLPSAQPKNLPVANKVVEETLSMPFYGKLEETDVKKICEILRDLKK